MKDPWSFALLIIMVTQLIIVTVLLGSMKQNLNDIENHLYIISNDVVEHSGCVYE